MGDYIRVCVKRQVEVYFIVLCFVFIVKNIFSGCLKTLFSNALWCFLEVFNNKRELIKIKNPRVIVLSGSLNALPQTPTPFGFLIVGNAYTVLYRGCLTKHPLANFFSPPTFYKETQMKAKLLALAVISAFALSACGSDDKKPKVNNNTKPAAQNTQGQNQQGQNQQGQNQQGQNQQGQNQQGQNQQGQNQQGGNQQGQNNQQGQSPVAETPYDMKQQVIVYQADSKSPLRLGDTTEISSKRYASNDGENFLQLVIDGKTVKIDRNSAVITEIGKIEEIKDNTGEVINTQINPSYAVFGYIENILDNENGGYVGTEVIGIYQGTPTAIDNMPKTGIVTYNGSAHILDSDSSSSCVICSISDTKKGKLAGRVYSSNAKFSADFDKKKLTGTIDGKFGNSYQTDTTFRNYKPINIDATIKANTFQGTANTTGTVEGKFYGANAQNIAGAFDDKSQNIKGVFGATKE